jgi:hypothetical protein
LQVVLEILAEYCPVIVGADPIEQPAASSKAAEKAADKEQKKKAVAADDEGRARLIAGLSHQLYLLLQEEGDDMEHVRLRNAACYLWAELLAQPKARAPMKDLLQVQVQVHMRPDGGQWGRTQLATELPTGQWARGRGGGGGGGGGAGRVGCAAVVWNGADSLGLDLAELHPPGTGVEVRATILTYTILYSHTVLTILKYTV